MGPPGNTLTESLFTPFDERGVYVKQTSNTPGYYYYHRSGQRYPMPGVRRNRHAVANKNHQGDPLLGLDLYCVRPQADRNQAEITIHDRSAAGSSPARTD